MAIYACVDQGLPLVARYVRHAPYRTSWRWQIPVGAIPCSQPSWLPRLSESPFVLRGPMQHQRALILVSTLATHLTFTYRANQAFCSLCWSDTGRGLSNFGGDGQGETDPEQSNSHQLLDSMHHLCLSLGLVISPTKTEVVVFNGPGTANTWRIGAQVLPQSASFKYLGLIFHESGTMSYALQMLWVHLPRCVRNSEGCCVKSPSP